MSRFQLLSDEQWALIKDLLPVRTGKRGRPFSDARAMVEGIIYRYRCGLTWRDVPAVFGPWQTIWTWHRRRAHEGTWDIAVQRLSAPLTCRAGDECVAAVERQHVEHPPTSQSARRGSRCIPPERPRPSLGQLQPSSVPSPQPARTHTPAPEPAARHARTD
jgi:transposase